ncbi:hypothetical protein F4861DRAFT_364636 [Xylaria intraflava]|nr:hypothetical protein F4861DRAFT_364636 [Xylaria intraflava]
MMLGVGRFFFCYVCSYVAYIQDRLRLRLRVIPAWLGLEVGGVGKTFFFRWYLFFFTCSVVRWGWLSRRFFSSLFPLFFPFFFLATMGLSI